MAVEIGDAGALDLAVNPDEIVPDGEVLDDALLAVVRDLNWVFSRCVPLHVSEEYVRRGAAQVNRWTDIGTTYTKRRAYLAWTGPAVSGNNVSLDVIAWGKNSSATATGTLKVEVIKSSDGSSLGSAELAFAGTSELRKADSIALPGETAIRIELSSKQDEGGNTFTVLRFEASEAERTAAQIP